MSGILFVLFRATLFLSAAFCVGAVLLRAMRCRSWRVHRMVWFAVLLLGVLAMIPFAKTVEIAVLVPQDFQSNNQINHQSRDHTGVEVVPLTNVCSSDEQQSRDHTGAEVVPLTNVRSSDEQQSRDHTGAKVAPLTNMRSSDKQQSRDHTGAEVAPLTNVRGSDIENILFFVWLFGMAVFPLRQLIRAVRFRWFLRDATEASSEWTAEWRQLQTECGVRKPIPMFVTENFGPALIVWRTALLVPLEGWDQLSDGERRSVMRHELEHYRRGDVWTSLFARLVALPHWFNPLVHLAVRRFEDAAEWACDEAALGQQGESLAVFAKALVSLQESSMQKPILYNNETIFQHHIFGRNISHRVARLLTFNAQNQKESIMKKAFLLAVCVLLLCSAFIQIRLVAQQKMDKPEVVLEQVTPNEDIKTKTGDLINNPEENKEKLLAIEYQIAGLRVAEHKLKMLEEINKRHPGSVTKLEMRKAELSVAEAKYELERIQAEHERKQAQEDKPVSASGKPLSHWLSLYQGTAPKKEVTVTKPLLFQGKTFEYWVYELQTELDPKQRGEAFRALAMFGANGRGKEVTEIIFDAAKNDDFYFIDSSPSGEMKLSVIGAFSHREGRIPLTDSMPILLQKFSEGNKSEKYLVQHIFESIRYYPETKEFLPVIFETLMKRDFTNMDASIDFDFAHPAHLLTTMLLIDGGDEYTLRFLKEAIAKGDASRFGWMFEGLYPYRIKEVTKDFTKKPFLGTLNEGPANWYSRVAFGGVEAWDRLTWTKKTASAGLTPFGESLLALLQESGINSSNEKIRETSEKVVDALLAVRKEK